MDRHCFTFILILHPSASVDVCRRHVHDGRVHLAGDEALPDQTVQAQLFARRELGDFVRLEFYMRGADGFVRILRGVSWILNCLPAAGTYAGPYFSKMNWRAAACASPATRTESVRM